MKINFQPHRNVNKVAPSKMDPYEAFFRQLLEYVGLDIDTIIEQLQLHRALLMALLCFVFVLCWRIHKARRDLRNFHDQVLQELTRQKHQQQLQDHWLLQVTRRGLDLEKAPNEMKSNKMVVMAAVKQRGSALNYASDVLKSDRSIVKEAIQEDGLALYYSGDDIKSDREIVILAVARDGLSLLFASDELKADKSIVMVAVEQNGDALQYASDDLRSHKDIVLAAIQQNPNSFQYALGGL